MRHEMRRLLAVVDARVLWAHARHRAAIADDGRLHARPRTLRLPRIAHQFVIAWRGATAHNVLVDFSWRRGRRSPAAPLLLDDAMARQLGGLRCRLLKMDVHSTLFAMVVFGEPQRRAVGGGGERSISCRTRRQFITNFLPLRRTHHAGALYSKA